MNKIRFVFVAKDNNFCIDRDFSAAYSAEKPNVTFSYVSDNEQALPVVYNMFLSEQETKDCDYVIFMHADVKLNVDGFIQHLLSVSGKYDIIGLCGCSKFTVSSSPLNWYCGSNKFPDDRWGCVTHGEIGNMTSFFSRHHPDITDHEVACIDGLCIVFTRKAIESGIRFDENLGKWDMYDTDLSMQAVLKRQLKLGVIVRNDLMHYSVGKSITKPEFLETELKFRQKWGFPIPANSPISEIANKKP